MAYLGNRQVTQYQSIPKSTQDASINHAGGVIDFDRNYYGADFRWTGKELLPNTTVSLGLHSMRWMKIVKALKTLI